MRRVTALEVPVLAEYQGGTDKSLLSQLVWHPQLQDVTAQAAMPAATGPPAALSPKPAELLPCCEWHSLRQFPQLQTQDMITKFKP